MKVSCLLVCLLLLLLLHLAVTLPPGEGVAVVALESYRGYLCRTFLKNSTLLEDSSNNNSSMGVCLLARPEETQPHNRSFILSFNSTNVTVAAGIDSSAFWVKTNEETFVSNETLRAEAWNKVCVGLSSTTPTTPPILQEQDPEPQTFQVWASLHGRLLDVPGAANLTGWEDVRVCVGATEWNDASFTGFVTGLTLFGGESEGEEEEGALLSANCSVAANELTYPLDTSWTTKGPVLTLDEQLEQDPCAEVLRTVVFEGLRGYEEALRLCRSLGGHFPTEEEAAKGQVETYNCTAGNYVSWGGSGGRAEEYNPTTMCPVLLVGGETGQRPCLKELQCTLCQVPAGLRYTLFGPRTDFDRYYTLALTTPPDGSFIFQGEGTSSIEREVTGWTLRSKLHREELHQDLWLMGRHPWSSSLNGAAPNLTFTVCNAIQFSSNDGVCLLRSERCDGRTDSRDKSDEENCGSRRTIGKDTYYDTSVNPFFGEKQKGTMFFYFKVMWIQKMSTEKGNAHVELILFLEWQDKRLAFIDTKMNRTGFPCQDVWTPTLNIFAGYSSGLVVNPQFNRTDCYVYWETKPYEEQQLKDPLMGRVIRKMNITQYVNLLLEYPCQLRVSRYPFGRYKCNLTFAFFRDHENIDWKSILPMDGNELKIKYEEDKDLLDFRLENVTAEIHDDKLTFVLHLAGQPDYHLTNSFLPSSLMFLICYSSLFFPIAGFNERIMVSLTSLLVLVALFSQASETYVRTPYYKLIDVWYVGLIFLCFSVVISNVLVNYLRVLRVTSQTDLMKKVLVAKKCNIGSQVLLVSCFLSLMFMFVLFSNNNL